MSRLKEKYQQKVITQMKLRFGYKNNLAVPCLVKVILNVGISSARGETKFQEQVAQTLARISGQKPVFNKAKKSIASFKVRQGQIIGAKVILRKNRLYDFVDKLINLTLPNVRDFRGLNKKSINQQGSLTIGFKEYLAFPEIEAGEVENVHGLEVCIVTTAKNREESFALLSLLGFPFVEKLPAVNQKVNQLKVEN